MSGCCLYYGLGVNGCGHDFAKSVVSGSKKAFRNCISCIIFNITLYEDDFSSNCINFVIAGCIVSTFFFFQVLGCMYVGDCCCVVAMEPFICCSYCYGVHILDVHYFTRVHVLLLCNEKDLKCNVSISHILLECCKLKSPM